ncbi:glycosyltransferase family 4 protein [Lyngbya confervoides]|uniref:Glycosyltransferase family 4 protein n=1 Tax=Lyngbya confervoides BDU141951 TaxID=1574623 RepID=A0ABD4T874_9CYAN|nr:glycosyltransferase family 4 protein [Lyngbya confervoides]MCM1984984.1 glycosyltransferase family 4 protein [Lyngbya confervoides BDU141951]
MHIAWIGKKSPPCGNVTYSREITNALRDRGYRVSFLHFAQEESEGDPKPNRLTYHKDVQEVSLPFLYKSQVYTIPAPRSSKLLVQALQDLNPDLVHASLTLSPLDFSLPEICEELHIPLVATFHPPFSHKHRNLSAGTQQFMYQLYAPSLANYDAVIIFSQAQRDLLMRLGVSGDRIVVIPNGVDTQKYSPHPVSNFRRETGAEQLFIYQGRIALEKNVESLLRAWKQTALPPSCKLILVGEGPLMNVLMPNYGPEHNILWLGAIMDDQQRIDILRGSDVFILPSFVEGLSLSLLEAMSCGVACMATDAGADGEVLEQGAGIVLNPSRVKSELTTLIPLLANQPELVQILGRKARQRVLDRYSLLENLNRLEQLYGKIFAKTPISQL